MNEKKLTFAGGCFWGVQAFARRLPGIIKTVCGYANGILPNPAYEDVCKGTTGHTEAVQIYYDGAVITLRQLAEELFTIIDPLKKEPPQYRSGFYYDTDADKNILSGICKQHADALGKPLITECEPLTAFYPAEDYHQNYLEHHPDAFCHVDLSRFGGNKH
jgi:peptide methionine sulfoxide reductase msrA/msrB